MLRWVQRAGASILVDPEGDEGIEGAENDGRFHHAVVVELPQELGAADPPLVELRLVDLRRETHRRKNINTRKNIDTQEGGHIKDV